VLVVLHQSPAPNRLSEDQPPPSCLLEHHSKCCWLLLTDCLPCLYCWHHPSPSWRAIGSANIDASSLLLAKYSTKYPAPYTASCTVLFTQYHALSVVNSMFVLARKLNRDVINSICAVHNGVKRQLQADTRAKRDSLLTSTSTAISWAARQQGKQATAVHCNSAIKTPMTLPWACHCTKWAGTVSVESPSI